MPGLANHNDRDRVLDATDLVALIGEHVALKPKGREHVGLCPFHDDRTPSLAVVTHKGGAFYKCFACGAAGNAIDFMMEFHRMSYPEALKHLAARAGIALADRVERSQGASDGIGKEELLRAIRFAMRLYRQMLTKSSEGETARAVLARRGIDEERSTAFALGYAPDRRDALEHALRRLREHARAVPESDAPPSLEALAAAGLVRQGRGDLLVHRLIFPICDELGRPIAFGGRTLRDDDGPKYINSPESPLFHKSRSLYGIHLAKQSIIKSRTAVVTEGYTDVIACHQAGFTQVVATLGTALTREHARVLRRLCDRVILLFDGDAAGMRAAERGVEVFFAEPIDVQVCSLPDGLDPDELLRSEGGCERFAAALAASVDALAHLVDRFRRDYATRGLSGRQQALEALFARLAELGFGQLDGVRKRFILGSLADLTRLPDREIESGLAKAVALVRSRPTSARRRDGPSAVHGGGDPTPQPEENPHQRPLEGHAAEGAPSPVSRARREAERHLLALLLVASQYGGEYGGESRAVFDDLAVEVQLSDDDDGPVERVTMPLLDAIGVELVRDPLHRSILSAWRRVVDGADAGGRDIGLAALFSELAEPRAKSLASELFDVGQSLASSVSPGAAPEGALTTIESRRRARVFEALVHAYHDLERLDRRERLRDRPDVLNPSSSDLAPDAALSPSPPASAALASASLSSSALAPEVTAALDRLARRKQRGADPTAIPRPGGSLAKLF